MQEENSKVDKNTYSNYYYILLLLVTAKNIPFVVFLKTIVITLCKNFAFSYTSDTSPLLKRKLLLVIH